MDEKKVYTWSEALKECLENLKKLQKNELLKVGIKYAEANLFKYLIWSDFDRNTINEYDKEFETPIAKEMFEVFKVFFKDNVFWNVFFELKYFVHIAKTRMHIEEEKIKKMLKVFKVINPNLFVNRRLPENEDPDVYEQEYLQQKYEEEIKKEHKKLMEEMNREVEKEMEGKRKNF